MNSKLLVETEHYGNMVVHFVRKYIPRIETHKTLNDENKRSKLLLFERKESF